MSKGILISFEGPDGAGKSSVLEEVIKRLENEVHQEIIKTREPGGVAIAEKIRNIILDIEHTNMDFKTELLLYIAARRQHLVEKVRPALAKGQLVFMDRFIDSSVAYQGYGRELDIEEINWLNRYATDDEVPDLTLLFDVPSEVGLGRIQSNQEREVNRLDLEAVEMHQKVRQGYLAIAEADPRFVVIDASQPFETVVETVLQILLEKIRENN